MSQSERKLEDKWWKRRTEERPKSSPPTSFGKETGKKKSADKLSPDNSNSKSIKKTKGQQKDSNNEQKHLYQQLTCPSCENLCEQAQLLPCHHSLCGSCVEKIKKQTCGDIYGRSSATCPVCKSEFNFSKNDIQLFPKNDLLCNIISRYSQESSKKSPAGAEDNNIYCELCLKQRSLAHVHCKTCKLNFCKKCLQRIHSHPAFQAHFLTDPVNKKSDPISCFYHPEKTLTFYCLTDKTPVCKECTVTGHKTHTAISVQEAYSEESGHLIEILTPKHSCENDIIDMNNLLIKIKDSKIETHKRVGEGFLDLHKILGDFEDLLIDTMNKQAAERVERVESFISHSSKKLYPLEGLLLYCKEALKEHNQGAFLQSVNHLTSQVVSIVDELYVPEDELKEDPYKSFRLGFGNVSKDLIDLLQSNLYHDKEEERPRTPKLYINNKYPPEPLEFLVQAEATETMTKTYSPEPKQYKRVSKSPPTVPPNKVVQVKGEDSFKMVRRQEKRPRSTPPYQEDHRRMNTFHCHTGRSHDDLEALPSSRNFSVKVQDFLLPRPPIIYQHIVLEDTAKV
ncbi:tripartite motif-containing protein 42-like [Huso huso]|uniref:Tripartite motif-containing protein 42-like n=1 Tax=Huso huso TaxID=61971 RepID=A0ABR0Z2P5_HUSHU